MRHASPAELIKLTDFGTLGQRQAADGPQVADRNARIAVIHDWCPDFRGGERVLAQICSLFANAEVFTLFDFLSPEVKDQYFRDVAFHTSAANRLPMVQK